MENLSKKRGAKPLSGAAMTAAQRKQRQRAKQLCYIKAAENSGCKMYSVLISDKQIESLRGLYYLDAHGHRETRGNGRVIDNTALNDIVYYAMKMFLENMRLGFIERGIPVDIVEMCANPNDYPADYNNLMQVEIESARLFQEWEKQQ